ncbi:MAG: PorT family protein [Prevotella sp.]|nr:PorT family protein [Prevotella sp.]
MRKLTYIRLALIGMTLFTTRHVTAQTSLEQLQVKVRMGYSIGGTTPLGMPASIRSIESFKLTPNFMFGADVMYPLSEKFGLQAALHYEIKDMDGEVTTKGYHMKVKMDEDELEGIYTGHVRQKVRQRMLTIPIQMTYEISKKVQLKAGPYLSLLLAKDFYGYAFDGYLRKDDPTGVKVVMGDKEGEWATYDFGVDMRTCQVGIAVGIDWSFYRNLGLSADLSWGLTGIHHSDFKTVEQTLYPIYGTIGLFYRIK